MTQKKLLIITDYFYPHWTGLSRSIESAARILSESHNVTVLTAQHSPELPKSEMFGTIAIVRSRPLMRISRACWSPQLCLTFLEMVQNFDAVLINLPCSNVAPIALVAKLYRKNLVLFHQGDLILRRSIGNWLIEKAFDWCTKISCALADSVSTYSLDYAQHSRILCNFLHKCTPVILPVRVAPSASKRTFHSASPLFGLAGRFVHEKGFDIAFRAIPRIVELFPNAHFLFAGDTNVVYEDFYQQSRIFLEPIRNHITFLGLLDEQEMRGFYEAVDFMIIPSRSDSFNMVQAEAALCGTPSISSDIPGLRSLIKETGFGILFEMPNPESLSNAVIEAVSTSQEIQKAHPTVSRFLDSGSQVQILTNLLFRTESSR